MKKNKKVKNVKKRRRRVALFLLLIIIAVGGYFTYTNFFKKSDKKIESKSKVVDSIDKYGYTISDTDTKLYKTKFEELKRTLNAKTIDNKKYSELVAELFIIDFYSLDNKTSKNDVGGVEYVYSDYKTSFIDKARDEFYKYVKSDLNDNRNQKLPLVSTIKVDSTEKIDASDYFEGDILKSVEEAYKIDLSWTYNKELGYITKSTLIVVNDGKIKFSVAKLIGDEE